MFVVRKSPPDASDKNWINVNKGGKNRCMIVNSSTGSVIPNCTGYAWGRFMEVLGDTPKLSTANAGDWYGYQSDGYQRGSTPKPGAVICWDHYIGNQRQAGHVAVVEKVNNDGSIDISHSGWRGSGVIYDGSLQNFAFHWQYLSNLRPPNYIGWTGYKFQGFIYNPNSGGYIADDCARFLQYFADRTGYHWTSRSCSDMIQSACQENNVPESLIPASSNISTFARSCFNSYGIDGSWHKGPHFGYSFKPRSGDIVFLRNTDATKLSGNSKYYAASDCGVVWSVRNDVMYVYQVQQNTQEVIFVRYSTSAKTVLGYYQPEWEKLGANPDTFWASQDPSQEIYGEDSTSNEMSLRQVARMSTGNEPSITTTGNGPKLSVINYTSGLAEAINAWNSQFRVASFDVDLSNAFPQLRRALQILMSSGYTFAASIGICANIQHESAGTWNPGIPGDYQNGVPTSFGLCQWHNNRGLAMKAFCGDDWATDFDGQIRYLMKELNEGYIRVNNFIKEQPNTIYGAVACAVRFVEWFEVPNGIYLEGASSAQCKRGNTAANYWTKVTGQSRPSVEALNQYIESIRAVFPRYDR